MGVPKICGLCPTEWTVCPLDRKCYYDKPCKFHPDYDFTLTNPDFWDCECENGYIHSAIEETCPKCGASRAEMPDSMQGEIDEGTHFAGV